MRKIAVITPVSHLEGIIPLLMTKGTPFLYEEASKGTVRELLLSHNIDTIVCNPNQQTYKIDKELLNNTNVIIKAIKKHLKDKTSTAFETKLDQIIKSIIPGED